MPDTENLQQRVQALQAENAELRTKLEQYENTHSVAAKLVTFTIAKWLGSNVRNATRDLGISVNTWQAGNGPLPLRESIDFVGASVARFTRIGAYRLITTILIAIATLWLGVAQVALLKGQNRLIDAQKRSQAAEMHLRLTAQREEILRSAGIAFDTMKTLQDSMATLDRKDYSSFESKLNGQGFRRPVAENVIEKCGIALYPVGNPNDILGETVTAARGGNFSLSKSKLDELVDWWDKANAQCKKQLDETRDLISQVQADMKASD